MVLQRLSGGNQMLKNLMPGIFKRRKFIVYGKLQLALMLISFSYVLLFCAVLGLFLFTSLLMELDKSSISSDNVLIAANQILYLYKKSWLALLLSLVAVGCHSIFISHRITGPIYRFNLIFKAIKEGVVPASLQLRKYDYLYRETDNINQMLASLREKLAAIQEAQAHLNKSILNCKDTVNHLSTDELSKRMNDLNEQGKRLEEKLGYFKVMS
jgi:methyl-accepting chemotaxis protein